MTDIKYKITFYSNWHCGSGLAAGADTDDIELLLQTFKWVKRLGLGRNRGYGRCEITKEG